MTPFLQSYNNLNPEQKLAVDTIDGPVVVIAGPGTGKTQLLSTRVANILDKTDTDPSGILCLTYTDSASFNMRQRLFSIIGKDAYKVNIFTFHALGTEIINQNPEYFFYGFGYRPIDEIGKISLVQDIITSLPLDNPLNSYHPDHGFTYLNDIIDRIKDLKNEGLTPADFLEILTQQTELLKQINPLFGELFEIRSDKIKPENFSQFYNFVKTLIPSESHHFESFKFFPKFLDSLKDLDKVTEDKKLFSKEIRRFRENWGKVDTSKKYQLKNYLNLDKHLALAAAYKEYQDQLHKNKYYDFEDMLLEVIQAFKQNLDLKYQYQEKFLYVLVDEFQDTNGVQMELIQALTNSDINSGKPNIMVVGDDDQSIFKFQKASIANILNFEQNFADPKIIYLTKNYRSGQDILDFADKIIENAEIRLSKIQNIPKKLTAMKKSS